MILLWYDSWEVRIGNRKQEQPRQDEYDKCRTGRTDFTSWIAPFFLV